MGISVDSCGVYEEYFFSSGSGISITCSWISLITGRLVTAWSDTGSDGSLYVSDEEYDSEVSVWDGYNIVGTSGKAEDV